MGKISNCGIDENKNISGGKAGDNNQKEYQLLDWWGGPHGGWYAVFRHSDTTVRKTISYVAYQAAVSDKIGYDQSQRTTYYNQLKKKAIGWDPKNIKTPCEADCSSSTCANIIAAGHLIGNKKLQGLSATHTTYTIGSALTKIGFSKLTGAKYTGSSKNLVAGDILLSNGHVAIWVDTKVGSSDIASVIAKKTYVPRLTDPKNTDKNYVHTSHGGYNKCIIRDEKTGCCLPNCVGYAWGRWRELLGKNHNLSTSNAENWYGHKDGYKRGKEPALGAVICWKHKAGYNNVGHVAIVEKIAKDGTITCSQSNFSSGSHPYFFTTKLSPPNYVYDSRQEFQGFIYLPGGQDGSSIDSSTGTSFSLQKGIEQLYSSDNYKWVVEKAKETAAERINKALASNVKSIVESYKEKPGNDETFGAKLVKLFLEKVELPTIKERVLTKGNLASYPNLVEAPYIEINLNGIMIGGYGGDEDKYPNHVASMEISKINGRINQYRINLIHQVRAGEDPNFIDSLLSRTGIRNKVKIMYGDSAYGAFFKEEEAYITNVTYSESVQNSAIAYTIEAVSSVGVMQQAYFNFPAVSAKPSSEIIKMLYENKGTSTQLLSLLSGMKDKQNTLGSGLIPTDDDEIMIPGGQDMSLQERLMQLVSYMHDSTSPTSNYFLSFEDDGESGSFFKITKVNKTNATTDTILKNCYYVDVGYPGNAYVTGFTLDNDVY